MAIAARHAEGLFSCYAGGKDNPQPLFTGRFSSRLRHGNKEKDAYSEDEIRFLSVVEDMIVSAVDDAINFDALRRTQDELRLERDRLQFLPALTGQITSNLELRELLRRVMRCDAVLVHLPDEERGSLRGFYARPPRMQERDC